MKLNYPMFHLEASGMCNVVRRNKKAPDSSLWFKTTQNLMKSQSNTSIPDSLFGKVFVFPLQEKDILDNLNEYTFSVKNIAHKLSVSKRNEKDILEWISEEFEGTENYSKYIKSRKFKREIIIKNLSSIEALEKAETYFDTVVEQYSKNPLEISQVFSKRLADSYKKVFPSETTSTGKYILAFMILEAINIDTIIPDDKISSAITNYIGNISHRNIRVSIEDISLDDLYVLAFSNPNISSEVFLKFINDVDKICDNYKITPDSWIPEFSNVVSNNINTLLFNFDLSEFNKLFNFFEKIKTHDLKEALLDSCGNIILKQVEVLLSFKQVNLTDEVISFMSKANEFKKKLR